jgi:aspartate/methionine/tyrosine aminotransferase
MQDRAREMVRSGHDVVHLDRGELDYDTPESIVEAAIQALREGRTRYTDSFGVPELREAIRDYYRDSYGVKISPAQVLVHAGSSPLLLMLFLALLHPDDEVVVPDPGYPAYVTAIRAARGIATPIAADRGATHYTASDVESKITPATRAVVVNSPCNPTGAVLRGNELEEFTRLGPLVVSDEAYHGLWLGDGRPHSMLEFADDVAVVNTFSKAFSMTG